MFALLFKVNVLFRFLLFLISTTLVLIAIVRAAVDSILIYLQEDTEISRHFATSTHVWILQVIRDSSRDPFFRVINLGNMFKK